jgi:uncharacterized protein YkwD
MRKSPAKWFSVPSGRTPSGIWPPTSAAAGDHRPPPRSHRRARRLADPVAGNELDVGLGSVLLEHLAQALGGQLFPGDHPPGEVHQHRDLHRGILPPELQMTPPALVLLLVFLWAQQLARIPEALQGPPSPEMIRHGLLAVINDERAAAGVAPLRLVAPLSQVAQQNAEEARDNGGALYDETSIPRIQGRLRQAGYQAHGWHQAFAAGKEEPEALVAWIKRENPDAHRSLLNPDYQEVGIGISEIRGTPLYDFFLAWRESESFARQTASLADLGVARAAMLARVNAERAAAGRPALVLDPRLSASAQHHAEDMLLRSYYNHVSPEGTTPADRARKSGYAPHILGENIARGPFTVAEVMDDWMQSREHRGNLLHPAFRDLGVGIAVGRNSVGYTVLWVQDFGAPQTFSPAPSSPGR